MRDPAAQAQAIIDQGSYMTLATADTDGRPWATPVWYAPETYVSLLWISPPGTRHSRNLERRAQLGIVIFDSGAPLGSGDAVFFEATAERVRDAELEDAIAIFSKRSTEQGGRPFSASDVREPARFRLHRARATAVFLGQSDRRVRVDLSRTAGR